MPDLLPLGLRSALETGNLSLFVGAGVGHNVTRDGQRFPMGSELAKLMAQNFSVDVGGDFDLQRISEVVEIRRGRSALDNFLKKVLADGEPDDDLLWLFSFPWKAIFTTNYDDVIERCYEIQPNPIQKGIPISIDSEHVDYNQNFEVPIYHLHGSLFRGDHPYALITQMDYATYAEHRRMTFDVLRLRLATTPVLYIGYSNEDPSWRTVVAEMRQTFAPSRPPEAFRITPTTNPLDQEILASQGITTIRGDLNEFRVSVQSFMGDERVDPRALADVARNLPTDLHKAFADLPAAAVRLDQNWQYVNQANFAERHNLQQFMKGEKPNWATVAQNLFFERDIHDSVYEDLLDFATSTDPKPRAVLLLAPAGYGVSTSLKILAARLVADVAGAVFLHRTDAPLIEGDVEFAATTMSRPTFFFVDEAATYSDDIARSLGRLRDKGVPACLVIGERLNQWRQRRARVRGHEYGIEPLSDLEIGRLLDFLESAGALSALSDLSRDLQVAQVRLRHQKELLVTLREVTEGQGFSAIIEGEYWGIESQEARAVYAVVAAFSRLRLGARDSAVAEILAWSLGELYGREVMAQLEGVVLFDTLRASGGIELLRARHQVIANIVWQRCLDPGDRERYLRGALGSLNLNFGVDVKAFEHLTRDESGIDSIGTLEGRIAFFEAACKKDPHSPYVRQHYARMLRRANQPELALGQVSEALKLDPSVHVVRHTEGLILSDLALTVENVEIARRRLAQSEAAFRRTIQARPKDEYGYQSLAELYLGWAKRSQIEAEATEYIRRAEEVISDGVAMARAREGLYLVSAEVARFLGDRPGVLDALAAAVKAGGPASIARYVLAREYLRRGMFQEARDAVHPLVESKPEEYRAAMVYAEAILSLGSRYREALAVALLGELSGAQDARYVALVGGLCVLSQDVERSKDWFARGKELPYDKSVAVSWQPPGPDGGPLRLKGIVASIKPGYAFVRSAEHGDFLLPGSKFGSAVIEAGQRLEFTAGFSARGGVASNPSVL